MKPAVLDKLVLTPSLRVAEAPETVVESEDSSEPEAEAELEIEAADEAEDATEAVEHHAEVSEETQPEPCLKRAQSALLK